MANSQPNLVLTPAQLDTLRCAALERLLTAMNMATESLDTYAASPNLASGFEDAIGYLQNLRQDLDALQALGYAS